MMSENKPRLALDLYVLAQGVKTGVYRVCDELFPRLVESSRFEPCFLVREGDDTKAGAYLATKRLPGKPVGRASTTADADILLSPFGVPPTPWLADDRVLQAHIVYDLIAIHRPDYFSREAADEVRNIMSSLDEHTVVFAISEYTKKELLDHRPDLRPEQVTVVPLAAGPWFKPCDDAAERARMRAKYAIPLDVPYVLSLATLEIRKNLDQVVGAYVAHMKQHPDSDLHLVLAGMSGWKLEKLEGALAAAGAWRARIVLTGFVDDADLSALYSDALCFVYLSRYEGFGLPPLEAMACGTPVICADNSSLPEVVADAGLSFDADDVPGVARAIEQLAGSAELRADLSRKGLRRAALFSWDRCADIVAETLLASHAAYAALPAHKRRRSGPLPGTPAWQTLVTIDSLPAASVFGYRNGSKGPVFVAHDAPPAPGGDPAWPAWADRLPVRAGVARVEGGRRTQGHLKTGDAARPLVSYVTVVRNNTATLARTLDSVQQQTYDNVEHIVLDGASTDGTLDIIRQYADRLDYFVSEADAGLYDAINKAVPLARGQLICILNSDDWLEPDAAEIAVRRMRNDLSAPALLLSAALVLVEGVTQEWRPAFVHPGSYFICANDCHNAIYATRAAYQRSGPYDTSFKIAADFKWIMTCMDAGAAFVYTREPTVNYSLGGTSSDLRQHSLECMQVVKARFPFLTQAEVNGLYHCFFALGGPDAKLQGDRPDNLTQFVQAVFTRHVAELDFSTALGWASMATLQHPADAAVGGRARFVAAIPGLAVRVLRRHPRLYGIARQGYRWLRG